MKRLCVIIMSICSLLCGCGDEPETEVVFIGDSIVAHWNLQESFPTLRCSNLGLGGTGLDYLCKHAGSCSDKVAVVISGTNDMWTLSAPGAINEYAREYAAAVRGLGASTAFVIAILPRASVSDSDKLQTMRVQLNSAINRELAGERNVVYLDFNEQMGQDGAPDSELFYDGLHPNGQGYERLSALLYPYLRELFSQKN